MVAFFVIGGLGLAVLLASLVLDDVFDSFFEALDVGDGLLSGPAAGAFLAAFGFAGALTVSAGGAVWLATLVGLAAGLALGAFAGAASRALMRMPTDATPSSGDLLGRDAVVITAVPADGFGEVSVLLAGQPQKFSARAQGGGFPAGAKVAVVAVLSPTAVLVGDPPATGD